MFSCGNKADKVYVKSAIIPIGFIALILNFKTYFISAFKPVCFVARNKIYDEICTVYFVAYSSYTLFPYILFRDAF